MTTCNHFWIKVWATTHRALPSFPYIQCWRCGAIKEDTPSPAGS